MKINAAVCYWTMPPNEFCPEFLSALKHKDSCLVVDIHSPTSIDSLAEFNQAGANIFLYLFQEICSQLVVNKAKMYKNCFHDFFKVNFAFLFVCC